MHIITAQLVKQLPKNHQFKNHNIINPKNFDQIHQLLTANKTNKIHITDSTSTAKIKSGTIIPVQDHINRTGTNILIGMQKFLGIDFIDVTNIYQKQSNSIITDCCGETLNNKYEYPSHYICHITTLAHMMNIRNIHGFLYNTSQKTQTQISLKI